MAQDQRLPEESVRAFVGDNGFKVDRIELPNAQDYFAFLHLSQEMKIRLGLIGDELLLTVLHHANQQQWFLQEIRNYMRRYDRLSKTAVLVMSRDARIVSLCRTAYADADTGYKTAHVALTMNQLEAARTTTDRQTLLLEAFRSQAFSIDHFDTRLPVPDDLFGRTQTVAQIEADVRSGREGVAILGVRRAGKTSVLKRVISQLRSSPENPRPVGYYDAQTHTVDATSQTAAEGLLQTLRSSARELGIELQAPTADRSLADNLRLMVQHLVETKKRSIVLAIDEIEWLIPSRNDPEPEARAKDYLRLFGLLRSLKQKYAEQVGLILCGTNETFCELPEIGVHPNPSLDWYKVHYVALLPKEDTARMLRELGNRMGLKLSDTFLDRTWEAFGGHAYLVRQFCSEVAKRTPKRPYTLSKDDFEAAYQDFVDRAGNVFKAILEHLARFYPDEYSHLAALASGRGPRDTTVRRHLRSYGLLSVDASGGEIIAMSALAAYLMRHSVEDVRTSRFRLLQRLGDGVSSVVWQAWDSHERKNRALKLFAADVSEARVNQEFAMLSALKCVFTPTAYEVTRIDDQLAIVMELVEGDSLERVLRARHRIRGVDLEALSGNLFAALAAIHPNTDRITALREELNKTSVASAEAWDELQDLLGAGHLHRDFKPANIIVKPDKDWNVRIVDLQLSAPVANVGRTRVGTPAYLPPDWGIAKWDVSFDLYGLGCVLFECVLGKLPTYTELETDLEQSIADLQYRNASLAFFRKALAPASAERYQSVNLMYEDWEKVVVAFV